MGNGLQGTESVSPGTVVGGCRIVSQLGKGGMGEVYLAEHLALERPVAIKVLPPGLAMSHEMVQRFLKEARACSRIEHPNVVTIHDAGKEGDLHYIIMQFIDGKNLAELLALQGGPLPFRSAVKLIRAATRGLAAVHQAGLIHRDVKPGNIMLAADSRVLLMDFGLVRENVSSDLTRSGAILGTPAYMSCEQCLGRKLDARSDIYAMGATLYTLLTSQIPFRGTEGEMLAQIVKGERPAPISQFAPNVPPQLIALVEKAMAYESADRFPTAKAMVEALGNKLSVSSEAPQPVAAAAWSPSPTVAPTETIPELEIIDAVNTSDEDESRKKLAWTIGGGTVIALLLLGVVINLVVSGSKDAEDDAESPPGTEGMIHVPAGNVWMGSDEAAIRRFIGRHEKKAANLDNLVEFIAEIPHERVAIAEFWIDKYEVTNAEYAKFVRAKGYPPPSHWKGSAPPDDKLDHPVVNVAYRDAREYAEWAKKKLPTPEQWLRAYRGNDQRLFPWGNDYDASFCNVGDNLRFPSTSPVTKTPQDKSPFGVYNLVGNAAELVRGVVDFKGNNRVIAKGASYATDGYFYGNAAIQTYFGLDSDVRDTGFRCVIEPQSK